MWMSDVFDRTIPSKLRKKNGPYSLTTCNQYHVFDKTPKSRYVYQPNTYMKISFNYELKNGQRFLWCCSITISII